MSCCVVALDSTTRGIDVFCTVNSFCEAEGIDWSKVKAVCTDGAPSMLGRNYGFQALVNEVSPDVIANHCMIHREALAEKTLPDPLNKVWKDVFKVFTTLNRVHSTPDSSATSAGAWKLTTRICSSTQRFAGFHVEMCCSGSSM